MKSEVATNVDAAGDGVRSRSCSSSITAASIAEADGTEVGLMVIFAASRNAMQEEGSGKEFLGLSLSSAGSGLLPRHRPQVRPVQPPKWDYIQEPGLVLYTGGRIARRNLRTYVALGTMRYGIQTDNPKTSAMRSGRRASAAARRPKIICDCSPSLARTFHSRSPLAARSHARALTLRTRGINTVAPARSRSPTRTRMSWTRGRCTESE
ncbi:hypothetical protein B0H17DRAFT_485320 [Mycena rosella]|uniref:Uncharacterized protein n=1 Tax=Mycena rosella TaxID=1033263 RepID=A0AAD7FQI9_MYCRO|nr:hypothetical protein B0H17DRAFT_485320 [Mycena rosella]